MKNILTLFSFFILLCVTTASYGQYGEGTPGADEFTGECRIDYVNAYRDGKACREGEKSFCGINQPSNSPQCREAQVAGYAAGYSSTKDSSPKPKIKCTIFDLMFRKEGCEPKGPV